MLKKLLLAASLAAVVFPVTGAHADPVYCVTQPGYTGSPDGAAATCTYTATGAGAYRTATPNRWSITIERIVDGKPVLIPVAGSTSTLSVPTSGVINSVKGDKVIVRQENDCAYAPVCGQAGIVAAYEEHA